MFNFILFSRSDSHCISMGDAVPNGNIANHFDGCFHMPIRLCHDSFSPRKNSDISLLSWWHISSSFRNAFGYFASPFHGSIFTSFFFHFHSDILTQCACFMSRCCCLYNQWKFMSLLGVKGWKENHHQNPCCIASDWWAATGLRRTSTAIRCPPCGPLRVPTGRPH